MENKNSFANNFLSKVKSLPSNSKEYMKSSPGTTLLSSIFCIVVGLIIGLIVLIIINPMQGFNGFGQIVSGAFVLPSSIKATILNSATLMLVGLSVTFAFKCGLFNIGVAGQFLMGILGCLAPALLLNWNWGLCLICGGALGAVWGLIPGLLKTFCNVNEVITSIMTNWIALFGVNEIIKTSTMYNSERNETFEVVASKIGFFGLIENNQYLIVGIGIAISIATYIFLNKTKFGYELRACGLNKDAAKYAGINHRKNVILAMVVSGMFAGLGAGLFYLSGLNTYNPNVSTMLPAIGFDGISVGLIGALNPIGGIFSSFLMAILSRGSSSIDTVYFPPEMASLIFGIIIYLCAFSGFFKSKIAKILNKEKKEVVNNENVVEIQNNTKVGELEKDGDGKC